MPEEGRVWEGGVQAMVLLATGWKCSLLARAPGGSWGE